VDGTLAFSLGLPLATFSLALTQNGVPIFGVVYDPFMDRLFTGEKGRGAYVNNKPIHVTARSELARSVIDIEANRAAGYNLDRLRAALDGRSVLLLSLRAGVYAGMLVAAGSTDGMFFAYSSPWDGAAVKIIVEEAGGVCTDMLGNDQRYDAPINGFIASNSELNAKLVEMGKKFAVRII
jgi:fructose-1,6-bisphosphatase/inositol monophosphatase family enzyme